MGRRHGKPPCRLLFLYKNKSGGGNVYWSISRVETTTYNAIIEAINGWIREKWFLDFRIATAKDEPKLLDEYVNYYK